MTEALWSFSRELGVDTAELRGMSVEAVDGGIGKVLEAVDQLGGAYLLVDTGPWIFGKTVKLPAGVVTAVDTDEGCVFIDRTKDEVKDAPEHDSGVAADEALTSYYGAGASGTGVAVAPASDEHDAPGGAHGGGSQSPFVTSSGDLGRPDEPQTDSLEFGHSESHVPASGESEGSMAPPPDAIPSERPEPSDDDAPDSSEGPIHAPQGNADIAAPADTIPSERSSSAFGEVAPSAELADEQPVSSADSSSEPADAQPATTSAELADELYTPTKETPAELEEQSTPAGEDSEGSADGQPAHTEQSSASGRRTSRDSSSKASTSGKKSSSGGKSGRSGDSRRSSGEVPIARYDSLTAAEVIARLRDLSQRELATVERYEKRHESRQTVLSRIDSLREKEPWRGYDDATVDEVKKKLADADEDRAKAVRDYERRHRDRKGVMEAARRTVAAA